MTVNPGKYMHSFRAVDKSYVFGAFCIRKHVTFEKMHRPHNDRTGGKQMVLLNTDSSTPQHSSSIRKQESKQNILLLLACAGYAASKRSNFFC